MYHDEANCDEYGGLYQWNEAMQYVTTNMAQGVCMDGWHIPSNDEWFQMELLIDPSVSSQGPYYIGSYGYNNLGGKLKESGYTHWVGPNTNATNESGFTALGSGYGSGPNSIGFKNEFNIWTSTSYNSNQAYNRELFYNTPLTFRKVPSKSYWMSIRCVKDQ